MVWPLCDSFLGMKASHRHQRLGPCVLLMEAEWWTRTRSFSSNALPACAPAPRRLECSRRQRIGCLRTPWRLCSLQCSCLAWSPFVKEQLLGRVCEFVWTQQPVGHIAAWPPDPRMLGPCFPSNSAGPWWTVCLACLRPLAPRHHFGPYAWAARRSAALQARWGASGQVRPLQARSGATGQVRGFRPGETAVLSEPCASGRSAPQHIWCCIHERHPRPGEGSRCACLPACWSTIFCATAKRGAPSFGAPSYGPAPRASRHFSWWALRRFGLHGCALWHRDKGPSAGCCTVLCGGAGPGFCVGGWGGTCMCVCMWLKIPSWMLVLWFVAEQGQDRTLCETIERWVCSMCIWLRFHAWDKEVPIGGKGKAGGMRVQYTYIKLF